MGRCRTAQPSRAARRRPLADRCVTLLLLAALPSGCDVFRAAPTGEVRAVIEPQNTAPYLLYRPTYYSDDRDWPTVVLCAGGAWQSAESVLAEWAPVADDAGWLLLAVETPSGGGQADGAALRNAEKQVLAAVQHARGGSSIDADQIFISGRGSAARTAAFVGLRQTNTFRLVALVTPHFDVEDLAATVELMDPHQQVLVVVAMGDLARERSEAIVEWLRGRRAAVREVRSAARPVTYPSMTQEFFARTVRAEPWVRIAAYRAATQRQVRFQLLTSIEEVTTTAWDFGDGQTSQETGPLHDYAVPGTYDVTLQVNAGRKKHTRRIAVTIP